MKTCVFIFFIIIAVTTSEDCNNTCYDGFQEKLQDLIDIYNNPPNITKLPSNYKNIYKLIKQFEEIPKHKMNITNISETLKLTNDTILMQKEIVLKIENIVRFLQLLNKDFDEMDNKTKFHNDTLDTCDEASKQFAKLKNDIDEIEEKGRALNESYYNNLDSIDRINEDSKRIKKEFDAIILPDFTTDYVCNSNLERKIKDILKTANNLKTILETIKEHILDKLRKQITHKNKILDNVAGLNKSLPQLPLISNNETKPLIDRLKGQLEDLNEQLKNLTPSENNLDEIKTSNDELLKELERILVLLFSQDNRDHIKAEIKKAKQIIKLVKYRNKLKTRLEDLEKIVLQLLKGEVCTIQEDIDLEPNVETA